MSEKKRLSDKEKVTLIEFYKNNPVLWDSDNPYYKNDKTKEPVKLKLQELFNHTYTVEALEKAFHSLRSSMLREVKRNEGSDAPSSKWKFYTHMEFLIGELTKEKRKSPEFSFEEIEDIIDYYRENPSLWNFNLQDYRDRTLREALMEKLGEQFSGKFTIPELKTCWHDILTKYKREKQREEGSRASGSGTSELYFSTWEHYNQMEFTDITAGMDEAISTLDEDVSNQPPKKKKKEPKISEEQKAKTELWKTLATSIAQKSTSNEIPTQDSSNEMTPLEKRAQLFGKMVADSLMQCDQKDWPLLKKKVMDLFYDYEVHKQESVFSHAAAFGYQTGGRHQAPSSHTFTGMLQSPSSAYTSQQFSPSSSNYSNEY